MAVVVVGGHSRSVGKTSVMAGLIARLTERRWTAIKITQYGHGVCSANGEACDCATVDHAIAVTAEGEAGEGSDTARYLAAGAQRSVWVRTQQGRLLEAVPRIRREIASAENTLIESNSILRFIRPDLYLTVLDPGVADFKDSARLFLDRADAALMPEAHGRSASWTGVSPSLLARTQRLPIRPPVYVTDETVEFVRGRLQAADALRSGLLSPNREGGPDVPRHSAVPPRDCRPESA